MVLSHNREIHENNLMMSLPSADYYTGNGSAGDYFHITSVHQSATLAYSCTLFLKINFYTSTIPTALVTD